MLFEGTLEVKYLYSPAALRKVNTCYLHFVRYLFSVVFWGVFLIMVSLLIVQSTFDRIIIILAFKRKKIFKRNTVVGFFLSCYFLSHS